MGARSKAIILRLGLVLTLSFVSYACGMNFYELEDPVVTESPTPISSSTTTVTTSQITKEWTHLLKTQNFANTLSFESQEPQVAINSSGQSIITWRQSDGMSEKVFKAERAADGSWTPPSSLSDNLSPDNQSATKPQVALNDSGQAVITWQGSDGTNEQIFKAERSASGTWTLPTSLSDNISQNSTDAQVPQVAINNSGQVIIAWKQSNIALGADQIYMAERAVNGVWTIPANLNDKISPDGPPDAESTQVALNNSGQAIITWNQSDGGGIGQIFKAERATDGTWTVPANLADNISPDGQGAYAAQVVLNDTGQAMIGWQQSDSANIQVFKAERAANGVWSVPANLADNISPDGQNTQYTQVALNSSGQAIVTWYQSDGANTQIFKAERAANGTWTLPSSLADNISPDGAQVSPPQVAMNNLGQTLITWTQNVGGVYQIFKAERASNGTWTVPSSLADIIWTLGGGSEALDISINDLGQAVITLIQGGNSQPETFKLERASNGTWSVPASLADNLSPDGQSSSSPQVALNDSGQALIAWIQSDGTRYQIFKAERSASGTWTTPASLIDNISPDGQDSSSPQVAMNDSGQAVITWQGGGGANYQIFKAERAANGTWTLPSSLVDNISPDGQNAQDPQLSLNDSGQAVITWWQSDGTNYQIFKAERAENGTWTIPTSLSDNISVDGQNVYYPKVAMNASSQVVISWHQGDSAKDQIFKAERAANGTWTVPANLADNLSPNGQDAQYAQVALNDSGQAIVTWYQSDGANNQIFKAERAENGVWSVPLNLADNISTDGQSSYGPQVALNSLGQALITWTQYDGSNWQIFKAERAANGTWIVPSNLADNISPDGDDSDSSTCALNDSGQAIVAWTSYSAVKYQLNIAKRSTTGTWTSPNSGIFTNQSPWPTVIGTSAVKINSSGEVLFGYAPSSYGAVVSTYR